MGFQLVNDVALLPVYLLVLFLAFCLLFVSVYFHELGHWFYFKAKLKKDIKIQFEFNNIYSFKWKAGTIEDYKPLTLRQYHDVNMFGILAGLIPIVAAGIFHMLFLLVLVPYIAGCWGDIKEMTKATEVVEDIKK